MRTQEQPARTDAVTRQRRVPKVVRSILSVLVVMGLVVVPPPAVFAVDGEFNESFFSNNSILFYDPRDGTCSTGGGTGEGEIKSLRGDNNGAKIFNFWVDAGLSPEVSAGITASMKHESGFSPFRKEGIFGPITQEHRDAWLSGGWGVAQFTHSPGQRQYATDYVRNAIGEELFNQYYKVDYGGPVTESTGFVPDGIPPDVNDKFLLSEMNYLLGHIKELDPTTIPARYQGMQADFGLTIPMGTKLYNFLTTLQKPADAAVAWTYLYEYPGNIAGTSAERGGEADAILALFSGGGGESSSSCGGGLTAGGMTLEEAKAFMETYKQIDAGDPNGDRQFMNGTIGCSGATDNCVAFSGYFINKYTDATWSSGNGSQVVSRVLAANPSLESGTAPKPYALFSTPKGASMCQDCPTCSPYKCGHTGIVLGVDTDRGVVITGEASWCDAGFTGAYEYPLADWTDTDYTFAYLDSVLKADAKGGLK